MQYPGFRDRQGHLYFRRGFLSRILTELPVVVAVPPFIPQIPPPHAPDLRDFQQEALRLIFEKRWGRIALPTNAGKGAVIASAAKHFAEHKMTALILCDEIAVFKALKEEVNKWSGMKPILVEAGAKDIPKRGSIVIAMVPTLLRRKDEAWLNWFSLVEAVLLDEGDKASSKSWQDLVNRCENSHYRIAFSGTFMDGEVSPGELILSELIGPVMMRRKNADMIALGISAKPFVELIPFTQRIDTLDIPPGKVWGEMKGAERRAWVYDRGIVHNQERHQMIASLLHTDYANAIIINYIPHGKELEAIIPSSVFLSGSDVKERRDEVLDAFKRGVFQTLIVSKILDRGTNDLGHAAGLIFASSMGSDRQTLQRVGRGLRRTGGKQFLYLKDVIDRGHPFFDSQSRKRVMLYNEEGFEVTIRG